MQKVIIGSLTALALAINVANAETRTIKMGTVAGPETEVMEVAARIAKEEYDLNVEIIEFTDYVTPNAALADGSLEGCELICPRHGARFDVRTGEALTMPATEATSVHEVKVDGDDLFVRITGE